MVQEGERERGVSPVTGVVLMVAITVTLGSVVAAMVLTQDSPEERPSAALEDTENIEEYGVADAKAMKPTDPGTTHYVEEVPGSNSIQVSKENWTREIYIRHSQGSPLDGDQVSLHFGEFELPPICTKHSKNSIGPSSLQVKNELSDTYSAGEPLFVWAGVVPGKGGKSQVMERLTYGGGKTVEVEEANIIWESSSGDTSYVLEKIEFDRPIEVPDVTTGQVGVMFEKTDLDCVPPELFADMYP